MNASISMKYLQSTNRNYLVFIIKYQPKFKINLSAVFEIFKILM